MNRRRYDACVVPTIYGLYDCPVDYSNILQKYFVKHSPRNKPSKITCFVFGVSAKPLHFKESLNLRFFWKILTGTKKIRI